MPFLILLILEALFLIFLLWFLNFSKEDVELLTSLYSYENIAFTNESHNNIKEPVGCILLLYVLDHIEHNKIFLKNLMKSNINPC